MDNQLFLECLGEYRRPLPVSPLTFTGAKHKLYTLMLELLPSGTTSLVSPFMGGASLELRLATAGYQVHASDIFRPIVEFFQTMLEHAPAVVERAMALYPIYKGDSATYDYFKRLVWGGGWEAVECPIERAALTWCISKQSFMGKNFASTPIKPEHAKLTDYWDSPVRGDLRWSDWFVPNITFTVADYKDSLSAHDGIAYVDPPYVNKPHFYGKGKQGEFAHQELRDILAARGGFILSYGDDPLIRELYQDYRILTPQWAYGNGKAKGAPEHSSELLILSHDVEAARRRQ